jgi:hypothetical protein
VNGTHHLVDRHHPVAVSIEVHALVDGVDAEGNIHAQNELVDRHVPVVRAIAHARSEPTRARTHGSQQDYRDNQSCRFHAQSIRTA